jgi:carbonic anhydrase
MRLFESIVDANHRALGGDAKAGIRPAEYAGSLPIVVLTCFDPRMHPLMPEVLGIAEPDFIWLTNAGNIVSSPVSSAARSLALACAVHDAREIAVIGHTDCRFFHLAKYGLAGRLQTLKPELGPAAATLDEFLHRLVDESSNVALAARLLRQSPLIPRAVPVHGLMVDVNYGRLEWVVNGYEAHAGGWLGDARSDLAALAASAASPPPGPMGAPDFKIGTDLPPIGGS